MRISLCFLFLTGFCALNFASLAQNSVKSDSSNVKKDNKTVRKADWTLGLDYYTRSVFLGRTDSIGSGYYSPTLTLNLKSGFFFSLAPSLFQQNTARPYGGLSLGAGYDKSLSDNFALDIQLIKNSYPTNSNRVNSTVSFEGEAAIDYINNIITSELNFQLLANKSTLDNTPDAVFTLTESHPFYFYTLLSTTDSFSITPSVNVSAGTQNFYFGYFNTKVLEKFPKRVIKRTKLASALKILDYEISLPVNYYIGRFTITVNPIYSIGENIIGKSSPLNVWSADIGIGFRL